MQCHNSAAGNSATKPELSHDISHETTTQPRNHNSATKPQLSHETTTQPRNHNSATKPQLSHETTTQPRNHNSATKPQLSHETTTQPRNHNSATKPQLSHETTTQPRSHNSATKPQLSHETTTQPRNHNSHEITNQAGITLKQSISKGKIPVALACHLLEPLKTFGPTTQNGPKYNSQHFDIFRGFFSHKSRLSWVPKPKKKQNQPKKKLREQI